MDGWTDLSTLLRRYGLDAFYAFESRATEVGACVRGEGVFESHEQFVGDLRNVAAADSYLLARRTAADLEAQGSWCEAVWMTETARALVDQFDSLPEAERQEVLVELLRRAAFGEHDLPDDVDLLAAADEVFRELDQHEKQE